MRNISFWKALGILTTLILIVWVYRYVTTPAPGIDVADQGREHVSAEEVSKTVYNSNPPTSGPHLATWVKPGVYAEVKQEGELIHSLEHGYVNIQYNCDFPIVAEKTASTSAVVPNDTCKDLIQKLEDVAQRKKLFKLLVVPRPTLDSRIALTAWRRIDKFNDFDAKRIEAFIDYWRDHGPEQTME